MSKRGSDSILFILLLCFFYLPAFSQDGKPEVSETSDVTYKTSDIEIYNEEGKPLSGIRRNEIEVWENGNQIEISELREISGSGSNYSTYSDSNRTSRKIILLWDFRSLTNSQLHTSLEIASLLVKEHLEDQDLVMLVSVMDNLQVIQKFTSDRKQLLNSISAISSSGPKAVSISNFVEEQDDGITAEKVKGALRFAANLQIMSSLVSDIDDRKNLILFSNGPGLNPLNSNNSYLREDMQKAVMELNSSNITVNVISLDSSASKGKSYSYSDEKMTGAVNAGNFLQRANSYRFLQKLADETLGGVVRCSGFENHSALLSSLFNSTDSYYLISFKIPKFDDEGEGFRSLEIRLKGIKGEILSRRGYFLKKSFNSLSESDRNRHLTQGFDTSSEINELGLEGGFLFNRKSSDILNVIFAVRCQILHLQPDAEGQYNIEMLLSNIRMDGNVISSVNKVFKLTAASETEVFRIVESLPCELGVNNIKVVIRDNNSGRRSYFYNNIMFRMPPADSLLLMDPVFIRDDQQDMGGIKILTEKIKGQWTQNYSPAQDQDELPVSEKQFPYFKAEYNEGETIRFLSQINNPHNSPPAKDDYQVVFAVSPRNKERNKSRVLKRIMPVEMKVEPHKDSLLLIGAFDTGGFTPGEYDLFVIVLEKSSGRQITSYSSFTVLK